MQNILLLTTRLRIDNGKTNSVACCSLNSALKMLEIPGISLSEALSDLKKLLADGDPQMKPLIKLDKYLERFLYATDLDVEQAYDKIKQFCDLLVSNPEWMPCDSPMDHKELIEKETILTIPGQDKIGRPILVFKLGNIDPSTMPLPNVVAVDDIWLEMIFEKPSYRNGLCVIVDIKNYPWTMMRWLTQKNINLSVRKMQCLPFRNYSIHVVNSSMIVYAALKMIWQFAPEWLKEMVKFHYDDRESLHKYINPEVLPPEYGGSDTRIDYKDICGKLFEKNEAIAESLRQHRTLVAKRGRNTPV